MTGTSVLLINSKRFANGQGVSNCTGGLDGAMVMPFTSVETSVSRFFVDVYQMALATTVVILLL